MIITYYPRSKSTHNFKDMKFLIKKNSKYVLNFLKCFIAYKWGVMCMTYKTKL